MNTPNPAEQLLDLCASAQRELILCAPFVKAGALARLLERVAPGVAIDVFTRWRPEEVASGVSDLVVLGLVEERDGGVHLCDRLHAKYVRADSRALVGSANLTAAALGWSATPNLELQVELPAELEDLTAFERMLRGESVRATAAVAEQVSAAVELLPRPPALEVESAEPEVTEQSATVAATWYPSLREPADLFIAYSEGVDRLSGASARAASADLAALEMPSGLDGDAFEALVATRLGQLALFERLAAFLAEPRRFGEVRDFLAAHLKLDRNEAEHAWQTLMRWLLHFLPGEYSREVPSHTEVVVRRSTVGSRR